MFTQSAFIRKNTPELREKLINLGLKIGLYREDAPIISACYGEINATFNKEPYPNDIDCGENENLFLALAALRDDDNDDYMQYFTDGEGGWLLHEHKDKTFNMIIGMYEQYGGTCIYSSYHKATPKELIEHFKDK